MSADLGDLATGWPVQGTREIHRDAWVVALREDAVTAPGGDTLHRLVVEHPGAVVVLAIDQQEQVLCLRQYRHAAQRLMIEIPAGLLDAVGEDPLDAAKRELLEEAELAADDWRLLLRTWSSAGITTERHHIYLARGLSAADRGDFVPAGEEAELEVLTVPFDELLAAVLDRRVEQGPLAQAVLAYEVLRTRGDL